MTERLAARPLLEAGAALGECPVWDGERGLLHWIDATRGELHRLRPADGAVDTVRLGARVGSIAPRAGGGLLAAVDEELLLLDAEGGVEERTTGPWRGSGAVVNDGACDGVGRFWVGSVHAEEDTGVLYAVEPGGAARAVLSGLGESNGVGFAPDDAVLYHADSRAGMVCGHSFAALPGELGESLPLLSLGAGEGMPDGLAVDAEGGIWVAIWGAGEVRRYSPEGALLAVVELPVAHVTSCCFGGPGLDQLFITTARGELGSAELAAQPLAGALFRADPGVPGLPVGSFGG